MPIDSSESKGGGVEAQTPPGHSHVGSHPPASESTQQHHGQGRADWESRHPRFAARARDDDRERFWINRISMPAGLATELTPPLPQGEIHLSWVTGGRGIAHMPGREPQGLSAGALMIALGGARISFSIDEAVTITHIGVFAEDYTLPAALAHRSGEIFSVDEELFTLLNRFAETAMSHIGGPSRSADDLARATMSAMLGNLLRMTFAAPQLEHPSRQSMLHQAAIAELSRTFADPQTTVESTAEQLRISRKHLERVFRAVEDSPYSALRAMRAARARALLADHTRPSARELARIAAASGFTSVRNMRRAIAATPPRGTLR